MNWVEEMKSRIDAEGLWEKEKTLKRSEYLKVRGSTDTYLYYVVSGSLRIFIEDEYEEQTIRFGYQNNFIAALDSFLTGAPSDFYIQAIKQSELKLISRQRFQEFVQRDKDHLLFWQRILEQLVFQCIEREKDLLTFSPVERYQRVLARSPQLFQEIPGKYIASYLRMSPETLSRIKKS